LATKKDFIVKNGLVVTDDITLDDGGSLKEAGGTAAFTFDGSGNVTKIGQDSPSSGEFLKWDGSKWVADGASGGASDIGSLSDVLMDATNFTDGFLLQPNSDGSAPTTGTLSNAIENIGIGTGVLTSLTSGGYNVAIGSNALNSVTTGGSNVAIGERAYEDGNASNIVAIGNRALRYSTSFYNTAVGWAAGQGVSSGDANADFRSGTFVGYGAGQKGGKTGQSWVTAIGYQAGANEVIGTNSVYIGGRAGYDAGVGGNNVAVGTRALNGNISTGTSFQHNIAIGSYSMYCLSASTASNNVAVGSYTGQTLTTGSENTLIGYSAGRFLTSGNQNVAIGYDALGDVTTGLRNIGIGYNAANNFDTESDNIAIGYDALGGSSLAGAEQNVSIGNYSGDAITSGDGNTIIGHLSGSAITSGGKNISLGYQAGDNITSGSNNVVIGNADVPSATGDSQLSISNGDGTVQWIEGNSSGVVLGALTPLFFERSALDGNLYDFRVPVAQSGPATPNAYPMPYDGEILAASFLFSGGTISGTGTNTLRVRKNGGSSGADIEDFTFTPSDLSNPVGTNYTFVKTGLSLAFNAGDIVQVRRNAGTTDLNNGQAIVWVRYNM